MLRRVDAAPRLTVAGRTDVGVHATGQVAHVDLDRASVAVLARADRGHRRLEVGEALARRLNGIAGPVSDVQVARASVATAGFDARFSALWRRYEYRIADAAADRDPRRRNHTLWHPTVLDVEAMDAAARTLLGLHDFAAFCRPRDGATTIRTLQDFSWRRDVDGVLVARGASGRVLPQHGARAGRGVPVGRGGEARPERPGPAPRCGRAQFGVHVVPARGLTLVEVGYPPDAELAARAEQTRAGGMSPPGSSNGEAAYRDPHSTR